MTAQINYQT